MVGLSDGDTHFMFFRVFDVCTRPETPTSGRVGYGRWGELQGIVNSVDCEVCLLLLNILRANQLERLFDSDQRQLAAKLKELLR